MDLLAFPDVDFEVVAKLDSTLLERPRSIKAQIEKQARYKSYIERQARDIETFRRDASWPIPQDLDYSSLGGLSGELIDKLERVRPETLDQAQRIEGMTPAGLLLILSRLKRDRKRAG